MRLKHFLYTIPLRLRSLLGRRRVEREPDEELQDRFSAKDGAKPPPRPEQGGSAPRRAARFWGSNKARRSAGTCAG